MPCGMTQHAFRHTFTEKSIVQIDCRNCSQSPHCECLYWLKKLLHFEQDSTQETNDQSEYYRHPI